MANFSVAILTAAPRGQPAEAGGAFVKLEGREALLRSVELFLNRDPIKQVQVVVMPDDLEESKRKYGPHLSFSGVKLISGGPRWIDQLAAASEKIAPDATHVILHDAARPVVSFYDIDNLIESAAKHEAIALSAPVETQLVQVDEGGSPMGYWHPSDFVQLLTPQVYTKEKFAEMARGRDDLPATQLTLLKGSPLNIRIRGGGDAGLAKAMMHMLPKPKIKPPSSPFEEAQW